MESRHAIPELQNEFLSHIANEYGFFQKTREVFLARFAEKNADSKNTDVAKFLGMDDQEFQDYLGKICEILNFSSSGRGRKPKGQSPWEKAFTWLWNERFNQWLVGQGFVSLPASEINIDWRDVCQRMLKKQQDQQRLRRQATEMGFEVNVHVPLGLVERKQQQRRNGNVELNQRDWLGVIQQMRGQTPIPQLWLKKHNKHKCCTLSFLMGIQLRLLPGAIADLFAQASYSGKITVADRYGLLAAFLEDKLTDEERQSIDRLLHALHRGRMQVVSEISAISS